MSRPECHLSVTEQAIGMAEAAFFTMPNPERVDERLGLPRRADPFLRLAWLLVSFASVISKSAYFFLPTALQLDTNPLTIPPPGSRPGQAPL